MLRTLLQRVHSPPVRTSERRLWPTWAGPERDAVSTLDQAVGKIGDHAPDAVVPKRHRNERI